MQAKSRTLARIRAAMARFPRRITEGIAWRLKGLDARKALVSRLPGVIQVGDRAVASRVTRGARTFLRKSYRESESARACFDRELLARELFAGRPWIAPITARGRNWFMVPYYDDATRLDVAASSMTETERREVARQAVSILFEIFREGYAHCDFHAKNMFWVDGRLKLVDFEVMTPYPADQRPPFPECYDITGKGLASPHSTGHMSYTKNHFMGLSLQGTLGVPVEVPLDDMRDELRSRLGEVSRTFETQGARHSCMAERIYASFDGPYLRVAPEEAQRNCARRFERFGITEETLRGRKVLDLGSNMGGMTFQAQRYGPQMSLGVEYDKEKVDVARDVALFNGMNAVRFLQADIDTLRPRTIDAPYDVVFCLAIEAHVKNAPRLYRLLGEVCSDVLYFEGNSSTDPERVAQALRLNGFKDVVQLGVSDDDCVESNNRRPLLAARKQ